MVLVGLHQGSVKSFVIYRTMLPEALAREIWLGSPRELLYTDNLTLACKLVEVLNGRLEAWEGAFQIIGLRVNVKKIHDD